MNAPPTRCLDEELADGFVDHRLTGDLRARVLEHLHACRECRGLVGMLVSDHRGRQPGASPDDPLIGLDLGRYRITARLGRGAHGIVYRAIDPSLHRPVAIKVLRTLDAAERQRLLVERAALARINHPHVVRVYDTGELSTDEGKEVFVVMELLEGGNLRNTKLEHTDHCAQLLRYGRQACRGLAAMHAAMLVHRDIKPDNLLIGDDGQLRVADLGLAEQLRADDEHSRDLAGTGPYLAPELRRGAPASAASDQYSLCFSLCELALARLPAPDRTDAGLVADLVAAGLRRRHAHALTRGLASNPADRHHNLLALADALKPSRTRVYAVVAAVGVVVCIGLATPHWNVHPPETCATDRESVVATFREPRIASLALPAQAQAEFHDRIVELRDTQYELCLQAPRTSAARSEHLRTSACLEDLVRAYDQALRLLEQDATLLPKAQNLLEDLPRAGSCVGEDALRPPPPALAIAAEVAALRTELQRIHALAMMAKYSAADTALQALESEVVALGYLPLTADVQFFRAAIARALDRPGDEQEFYRRALAAAEASGHDRIRGLATMGLLIQPGLDPAVKAGYVSTIEAVILRAARDPSLRSALRTHLAAFYGTQGDAAAAYRLYAQAAEDLDGWGHASPAERGRVELGAAVAASALHRAPEAKRHHLRALADLITAYGDDHPRVAIARAFFAETLGELEQHADALSMVDRALASLRQALGPRHSDTLFALLQRCQLLTQARQLSAAEQPCQEVLAYVRERPDQPPSLWNALRSLGKLRAAQGRQDEAIALLNEALAAVGPGIAPADLAELEDSFRQAGGVLAGARPARSSERSGQRPRPEASMPDASKVSPRLPANGERHAISPGEIRSAHPRSP